jgi:NAD(P)-dependent dehydrogenase (short-subunit alcohol dehydrogenase family)
MKVAGRVAIVTGGAGGIGGALTRRLVAEGASVLVADLDGAAAARVAGQAGTDGGGAAISAAADVTDEAAIAGLIDTAERAFGPVDLYFANAGVGGGVGLDAPESAWDLGLEVNLRAHVRAAKLLVPRWVERGAGYFVATASAAGLLTQIGSPVYAVSKHAAVGFAEWLSVSYGDQGVRVSCLCPMGVNTAMLNSGRDSEDPLRAAAARSVVAAGDVLEPDQVAEVVLHALDEEHFLILPHPDVLRMYRHKGSDYDRWLQGMRRYQRTLAADG